MRDLQTNADGAKLDCAALPPVEQGLGAHSAPLGLSFATAPAAAPCGPGALVGVHGSWNRARPGRRRCRSSPGATGRSAPSRPCSTGSRRADGSRWGRPVMAVQGPDGAVYVTDDLAGAVYRMAPA